MKSQLAYPDISSPKIPFRISHPFVLNEDGTPRRFASAKCAAMTAYAAGTTFTDEHNGETYDWDDVIAIAFPHR